MSEDFYEEQNSKKEIEKPVSMISPTSAGFIAVIGIFLIYQIGGAILTLLIFGIDFQKADVNAMRLLTMGGQILLMLLPTLLFARYVYPTTTTKMLRVKFPNIKELGIFLLGFIILLPLLQNFLILQNYLIELAAKNNAVIKNITNMLDQLDKAVRDTYGDLLKSNSIIESILIVIVVAVVPAICEEFLFRGFVQKSFEQKFKPFTSILITSLFFGLYHFNPYDLVALIALGFYFGFAANLSNSTFVSIILHFVNNFITVLAVLFLGTDELINKASSNSEPITITIISLLTLAILFFFFIYYVKKNYSKFAPTTEIKI